MNNRNSQSTNGLALLVVLWVMAILMVTVLSFSFFTRTETNAALVFKESAEKKFLAEAGVERAIIEIFYRRQNAANPITLEGAEVWKADGSEYKDHVGDGYYKVRITGEAGKLDINKASDLLLKDLFLNSGIKEAEADIIVDSLMDWKDPNGLTRLHGAGSDYYKSLPIPYNIKNASFDSVEEVLLVKGMSPGILYGDGNQKGIIDFLTVYSGNSAINLNFAPKEVLMAVPGIPADMADAIIQYRNGQPIKNIQEAVSGNYQQIAPYLTTDEGNIYTIEAEGHRENDRAGYPIKATVIVDSNNKYRYLYYKSPAYRVK